MDVNNEVKQWETLCDNSSHPDYHNTQDNLTDEDNSVDGYDTGDEWIEEIKDKCIKQHVMGGGIVAEI